MSTQTVATLKVGDYFQIVRKNGLQKTVYVRGAYDKSTRTYSIYKFEDINAERFVKGATTISTDIDF